MVHSTVLESGVTVPCLENPGPLEQRQPLLFLAAHAQASEADHYDEAAEPSEANPKAKAKAKEKAKAKAKEQSHRPSRPRSEELLQPQGSGLHFQRAKDHGGF